MTSPGYGAYLDAAASLAAQAPTLAARLAEAANLGQPDLDAAARRVIETDDESWTLAQRLSAADETLVRMTHEMGLELVPVAASQTPPGSMAEADRLISDLQRELTAIERNCDWVRTHRVTRARATAPPAAPTAVPTAVEATQVALPANRPRRSSMIVIGGLVLVVLILVVVLVLR